MKMLELAVIDDGKQFYRDVAKKAIEGNEKEPKLSVPVQLWEATREIEDSSGMLIKEPVLAPGKEDAAKLVNALRSGLAGAKEGVRFSVEHKGQIAWVSVNEAPIRKRAPKKAVTPKLPKPGK